MILSDNLKMLFALAALSCGMLACPPAGAQEEEQELLPVQKEQANAENTANTLGDMPIKDLRLPLDRYEDGRIKTLLVASSARVPPSGEMVAETVRVEFYKDDAVDGFIEAENCRFNREDGIVKSEARVRIERDGLVITGTGFECSVKDHNVKILADIKVVFERVVKEEGVSNVP